MQWLLQADTVRKTIRACITVQLATLAVCYALWVSEGCDHFMPFISDTDTHPVPGAPFTFGFFGLCHGAAHGLEMPWAANPVLFASGFAAGTATLHLFGVGIGHYFIKSTTSSMLLRLTGLGCALYGMSLLF